MVSPPADRHPGQRGAILGARRGGVLGRRGSPGAPFWGRICPVWGPHGRDLAPSWAAWEGLWQVSASCGNGCGTSSSSCSDAAPSDATRRDATRRSAACDRGRLTSRLLVCSRRSSAGRGGARGGAGHGQGRARLVAVARRAAACGGTGAGSGRARGLPTGQAHA